MNDYQYRRPYNQTPPTIPYVHAKKINPSALQRDAGLLTWLQPTVKTEMLFRLFMVSRLLVLCRHALQRNHEILEVPLLLLPLEKLSMHEIVKALTTL